MSEGVPKPATRLTGVPQDVHDKVDEAILAMQAPLNSYPKIHAHFGLKEAFGVSLASLREYGRRLCWQRSMASERMAAISLLGDSQADDWRGFARNSAVGVVNALLDFFLEDGTRKKDPAELRQAVANFATAYKAWMLGEATLRRTGKADKEPDSDAPADGVRKPFSPEFIDKVREEIYGLPPHRHPAAGGV